MVEFGTHNTDTDPGFSVNDRGAIMWMSSPNALYLGPMLVISGSCVSCTLHVAVRNRHTHFVSSLVTCDEKMEPIAH